MGKLTLAEIEQLSCALGKLGYLCAVSPRKVVLKNLAVAFPNLSSVQRERIAKDFFYIFAAGSFELLHFLNRPERMDTHIAIEGLAHLKEAHARGKGIIGLTAHYGNFPLIMMKLVREGFNVAVIARPLRDAKSGDFIHNLRTKTGIKTIFSYPRRECVSATIRALRDNAIVCMLSDQNFGTGGVWVDFFGTLAATPTGASVFALRTDAAVVPMFIVRNPLGKYILYIDKAVPLVHAEENEESILINTARFSKIIEAWIERYPEHWGWIHKRWKSRPSKEAAAKRFTIDTRSNQKEVSYGTGRENQ
jgi:KDO2-lipid IV(A) lauroyltransferase